jgi:hypothetical protein
MSHSPIWRQCWFACFFIQICNLAEVVVIHETTKAHGYKRKEATKIKEYHYRYYLLSCWNLVQKYGDFLMKNVRDLATRKLEKLFLCPFSKSITPL